MSIDNVRELVMPNDPAALKKIKDAIGEISNAMARIAGEKDYIKEALKAVSEEYELDKKVLAQIAKAYYNANKDEVISEAEKFQEAYDKIFPETNRNVS
jgi:hypothetical protein